AVPGALLEVLRRQPAAEDLDRRCHVRTRSQHARDVTERGALLAALGQRARRFSLEVDDHPSAGGGECLAQVIVAVGADNPSADADLRARGWPLADALASACN